jgi:PAS domain S-box-containing protein
MGVMATLFWFIMLMTAKRLNREMTESLNLRYENVDLISDLEKEIIDRKDAEEKLKKRNREIETIVQKRTEELHKANEILLNEIEEREEIVKALRESEEKYRDLANSLPQIVFESDIKGNITFTNHNSFKVFEYTKSDLDKGMNLLQMLIPSDRQRALENLHKVLSGEKSDGNEYTAERKDGSTFPVVVHSDLIKREGKVVGTRGIVIDLTQQKLEEENRKKLEAQLVRAQKMEDLGTLAGGVAHDLNNMLSGIVGYPDLLLMQIPDDSPLRKPIVAMQESADRAAAIVQDLLTLTRRSIVVEEVVNLNDIVSEYLESPEFKRLMSLHPYVELEVDLAHELPSIIGSPFHLTKAIMNLVSNALEAIQEEGHPTGNLVVRTENNYLDSPIKGYDEVNEGEYSVLKISDNGTGISAEDLERIFEPFFTKKVMGKSGTGLGMAVVWGTVKDHEGYIDVESIVGQGTTFTLYFPVTEKKHEKVESQNEKTLAARKGESILVVDDIEDQRKLAHAMLSKMGYSVSTVSSGEEAVEYMKNHQTDLLVLDMIMDQGMNGLDTYKKILEIYPGQKAVIASGYSETLKVKEAQRLGAGPYIKKPFTFADLGKTIRSELDRK